MAARFITLAAALASAATVLADTSIVTWSSSRSTALDALPANVRSTKFTNHILNNDQLCDFDAVVLIQQPGANRAPSSHITRSISSAPSARSFKVSGSLDLLHTAESLSSRCGARFLSYAPGPSSSGDVSLEEGKKHVLCLKVPHPHGSSDVEEHESTLAAELATISSVFPSHLIIYTGPGLSNLHVRQAPDTISRPVVDVTNSSQEPVTAAAPGTTFWTTGLITALLVIFFIFLPVLIIGVGALASIQAPARMEAPKGYSAVERKNQ
ncbi:hypothetical protein P691DRAFT_783369 [Macrolepiota fuliginosa MF-IS2]|uniref:V-type proton ATPase subunit S1/VOA1 transmembrane domain-containing protein n=1 Tax=Macrolepiota fuliginosa MF-IS2 TaxID=1400762 RepID=A0A9P5X8R8_9AGAR|nr:hypothetical protein P691DRAFT_783369 [Macrolepiota fuliginosa MF-IS2]